MKKYRYDAFISYRHTELDRFAAENLHRQMEAFRLPGKLSGKTGERTRIERVFRDKDELPLTNNLEDPIMEALAESEYLIVICSPRLRESLWCRKEIETFIRMHGREKVLAVLIEGEPAESFPEELLYVEEDVTGPDGSVNRVRRAVEPLAADIRGGSRRRILKCLKTEKLRLLAPMFSLNYDDLRQRHRERRMKRILGGSLAAAAVFLCFGAFSTAMALKIQNQNRQLEAQKDRLETQKDQLELQKDQLEEQAALLQEQSDEIRQQNESLLKEQALNLAEESLRLLAAGDRIGAIQTAIQSLTEYEGIKLPHTALGEYALTESLHVYDSGAYIKPKLQMKSEGIIRGMRVSPDGKSLLTCDDTHVLSLWNIATGSRLCMINGVGSFLADENSFCFLDNERIAYLDEAGSIMVYDWQKEESRCFLEKASCRAIEVSGNLLAVECGSAIQMYRADTLEYLGDYVTENVYGFSGNLFVDGEGKIAAFQEFAEKDGDWNSPRRLVFWNTETGKIIKMPPQDGWVKAVRYVGNTAYVLCNDADESYTYTEAVLTACNVDTGEILWTKLFADCSGSALFQPGTDKNGRILVATTYDVWLVDLEDGEEAARFSMGSSIAGGETISNGNIYIVYTRNGEYHSILTDKLTDYVAVGRFQSHSQNVKEFIGCNGGCLVLPYQDNKVTYYTYSGNPSFEALEKEAEPVPEEYLMMNEAEEFAEQNGLFMPALAEYVFYSGDKSLVYVCYSDETLRIYDALTFALKSELALKSSYASCEMGKDEQGNRFVGGGSCGYKLSPDLELLAVIENLWAVDFDRNLLIVKDRKDAQYGIPVYTVEELLDNARRYVLSCNYSESGESVFE